ncbi:DUF599 domain-containing protein [Notoacmeibacter ruber]|uniref:DUF599 family protein n=1 Tax=Notoacmeibacter ruber TaxID=2670375 RepID=A0A3L7JGA6_9HYPH|nr:DUF599 family protein [Notoacmeibacter ruber]RLQ89504.1 DUF599 family protein [Notoacmeibacter ruber]
MNILSILSLIDIAALLLFFVLWLAFGWLVERSRYASRTLSMRMSVERAHWMEAMAQRDLRMIDTGIMAGLQQGTAFFASSALIAIGGAFTLLDQERGFTALAEELPEITSSEPHLFQFKLLGMIAILAYGFFKFAWSYRLFNYASILIGGVPNVADAPVRERRLQARKAAGMNIEAGRNFNAGLRAIFFALGYIGWFVSGLTFICATVFITVVLIRRQFSSPARIAVLFPRLADEERDEEGTPA